MKEEYRFLLTGTQKIWLHNQQHRLKGYKVVADRIYEVFKKRHNL